MLILHITFVLVLLVMAENMAFHRPWLQSLIFALALAVGLTPEHLPTIMTITMARGAVRLSRERVIVKNMMLRTSAIEHARTAPPGGKRGAPSRRCGDAVEPAVRRPNVVWTAIHSSDRSRPRPAGP